MALEHPNAAKSLHIVHVYIRELQSLMKKLGLFATFETLMMLLSYPEKVFLVWFQGLRGKAAESHISWMTWNLSVGVINTQFHYSDFAL